MSKQNHKYNCTHKECVVSTKGDESAALDYKPMGEKDCTTFASWLHSHAYMRVVNSRSYVSFPSDLFNNTSSLVPPPNNKYLTDLIIGNMLHYVAWKFNQWLIKRHCAYSPVICSQQSIRLLAPLMHLISLSLLSAHCISFSAPYSSVMKIEEKHSLLWMQFHCTGATRVSQGLALDVKCRVEVALVDR